MNDSNVLATQTFTGTTHSTQDSQQLAGTRWRLDPSGSSAAFSVPNLWGLGSVKGRFQRLDGWLEADGGWRMELTLDAGTRAAPWCSPEPRSASRRSTRVVGRASGRRR
jgi:hypothetical protein